MIDPDLMMTSPLGSRDMVEDSSPSARATPNRQDTGWSSKYSLAPRYEVVLRQSISAAARAPDSMAPLTDAGCSTFVASPANRSDPMGAASDARSPDAPTGADE